MGSKLSKTKEYQREYKRKRRLDPEFRKRAAAICRTWNENNKEAVRESKKEYNVSQRAAIRPRKLEIERKRRLRRVLWDKELTELVKTEARHLCTLRKQVTGFSWNTDHLIPLQGKEVSGLDVWNNIQVIPQRLNNVKYNSYETDWD